MAAMKLFLLACLVCFAWVISDDVRQIRCATLHQDVCISPVTGRPL